MVPKQIIQLKGSQSGNSPNHIKKDTGKKGGGEKGGRVLGRQKGEGIKRIVPVNQYLQLS